MSKNSEGVIEFEEKDEYKIIADKIKNRLTFEFIGKWKKAAHVPNYVEHVKKAVTELKPGYSVLSSAVKASTPGFSTTGPLKDSLAYMREKGVGNVAVVISDKKGPIHQMVVNVVMKLAKLKARTFKIREEAEAWLDEEEAGLH